MAQTIKESSMCWGCRNAAPTGTLGCPWSLIGQPVENWTAEEHAAQDGSPTYAVSDCPMYDPDTGKQERCDGGVNAFRGLAYSIATQCVMDYRDALTMYTQNRAFIEICIARREQFTKIRDYIHGKRQRASRRGDAQAKAFYDDKKAKLQQAYKPYERYAKLGVRAKNMISDCEEYFMDGSFGDMCDMDGTRVMHIIQSQVKQEVQANG